MRIFIPLEVRNRILAGYVEINFHIWVWILNNKQTSKKLLEASEMWFCKRMLKRTVKMSNLCFHKTQRYLIINTRKRQSFLWHIMRRNWSCLRQQERFLKKDTVEVTMRRFLTVFYHGDERCQQSNLYAADDNRMWRSMINNTSWESTWWWWHRSMVLINISSDCCNYQYSGYLSAAALPKAFVNYIICALKQNGSWTVLWANSVHIWLHL